MSSDESALHGAGEPRQPFSVVAQVDWDDGFPPPSGRRALVFIPRDCTGSLVIFEVVEPAVPGGDIPSGGDSM